MENICIAQTDRVYFYPSLGDTRFALALLRFLQMQQQIAAIIATINKIVTTQMTANAPPIVTK